MTSQKEIIQQMEKAQSMGQIVWSQFKEHTLAVCGAVVILFFVTISLLAPVIESVTGLNPDNQNVANRYLPPLSKSVASTDQRESEIEKWIVQYPEIATQLQNELTEKGIITTAPDDALYELAYKDNAEVFSILKQVKDADTTQLKSLFDSFESYHLFGTDELGRDVFIRLVYGTRVSMGVGVLVAIASALIGLLVGSLAGFYGGLIDSLLMRVTDALISLPHIPVLIVLAAIDLTKLPTLEKLVTASNQSIVKMVIILCIFSWMTVARLVRGSILSIREREFVLAARTLGARDSTIIFRHMFPNVLAPMLVSITLGVGESILFEAALSFLGLGIMPPTPSWGNMLNNAQELIYQAPFLAILPGILILLTVVSFNYLGDGLQQAIDPKSIRR
ncbi:MAG: ABC transporter permease [Bdellovibrionia bacterium]